MRTIPQIKKDLEFNKGLSSLLEVLKLVAVSQFRALERRLKSFDKLSEALESFFVLVDTKNTEHPFLNPENKSCCVVAVTSDVGLLGGLNMQVINTALSLLGNAGAGELAVIGERGQGYARERNTPFTGFKGISEPQRFSQAIELRDFAVNKILKGECGSLAAVYPRAISITVQRIETAYLLPYSLSEDQQKEALTPASAGEIIRESSLKDMIEYLIKMWLAQRFYEFFGLSRLAEFAARFIHLEESSQRLKEMEVGLRRQYFRQRHEIIDRSMRELFSARSLYAR